MNKSAVPSFLVADTLLTILPAELLTTIELYLKIFRAKDRGILNLTDLNGPNLELDFEVKNPMLLAPSSVVVEKKFGHLLVLDRSKTGQKILRFKKDGTYLASFEILGLFIEVADMALDLEGNLVLVNAGEHQIFKLETSDQDYDLEETLTFGKRGTNDGEFQTLRSVAIDQENNILVPEGSTNKIQIFNSKGQFLRKFGTGKQGGFRSIAVDYSSGTIVTVRASEVVTFSPTGQTIHVFGGYGSSEGCMMYPSWISIDNNGTIVVGESVLNQLQIYNSRGSIMQKTDVPAAAGRHTIDTEGTVIVPFPSLHKILFFRAK